MKALYKIVRLFGRLLISLAFVVLMAILITSFSAIYNFAEPTPFSGDDIFNPYAVALLTLFVDDALYGTPRDKEFFKHTTIEFVEVVATV